MQLGKDMRTIELEIMRAKRIYNIIVRMHNEFQ